MQKVRLFVRQVGVPDQSLGVISAEDFNVELEYQYLSQGYTVIDSHYLGEVKNSNGANQGYRFALLLSRDEGDRVTAASKNEKAVDDVVSDAPKKVKAKSKDA
jgi:hypothetical protein